MRRLNAVTEMPVPIPNAIANGRVHPYRSQSQSQSQYRSQSQSQFQSWTTCQKSMPRPTPMLSRANVSVSCANFHPSDLCYGTNCVACHRYFDCTFQPTPAGYKRPPFGVATARAPDGYSNPDAWTTLPGSCTGNNNASVEFPFDATHGSFRCITSSERDALVNAFGW